MRLTRGIGNVFGWWRALIGHARNDGLLTAFAHVVRTVRRVLPMRVRDDGEVAAERYLRALGYRIIERNWRSPRDQRDEADLLALTPDRSEGVIVEVKRASGPWDALDRVDSRKKEVLWRLLLDLEAASYQRRPTGALARTLSRTSALRVDLVGVRGDGRHATMVRHDVGIFERRRRAAQRRNNRSSAPT